VYETEPTPELKVPNSTKESTKPKHNTSESTGQSKNPPATASEVGAGGKKTSTEKEPEESTEKQKSHAGGAAPSEGGGNGPGGESSKSANKVGGNGDGVGGAEKVAEGTGTPVAHKTETSSGGSSPVVPILIAVIVLAAISIGVVLYRQRKSGGQGPDRRVSSPNAS
jgi:cobalamin biosynthesis Mg chelatase CobN